MPDITSTTNPKVKACKELHLPKGRARLSQTLVEGPKVFGDFVRAGFRPSLVLGLDDDVETAEVCSKRGFSFWTVSDRVLRAASDTVAAQSPVVVFAIPASAELRTRNTVVLVDIADPGNVGTTIRSAAGFGWDVAYAGGTADPWAPKSIRAGAGAQARTRLIRLDYPISQLEDSGLRTLATAVDGGEPPTPTGEAVALLIGSEAHGLAPAFVNSADATMSIPMAEGSESLNAAVAASVLMYALT